VLHASRVLDSDAGRLRHSKRPSKDQTLLPINAVLGSAAAFSPQTPLKTPGNGAQHLQAPNDLISALLPEFCRDTLSGALLCVPRPPAPAACSPRIRWSVRHGWMTAAILVSNTCANTTSTHSTLEHPVKHPNPSINPQPKQPKADHPPKNLAQSPPTFR